MASRGVDDGLSRLNFCVSELSSARACWIAGAEVMERVTPRSPECGGPSVCVCERERDTDGETERHDPRTRREEEEASHDKREQRRY